MFYVYALLDPRKSNQPFYIGKGSGDRPNRHLNETYQNTSNRRKWCKIAAIRRAGLEPGVEIISKDMSEDAAYDLEAELISKYGRRGYEPEGILTNICLDNRPPSGKGRKYSDESRAKMSASQIGELNPRFGKSWSPEEREKRRQFNLDRGIRPPDRTGRKLSNESKRRISEGNKGKSRGKGEANPMYGKTGEKNPNFGSKRTADQKANMSAWQQRTYTFTSPDGKTYKVKSSKLQEFCKSFGMSYGAMMARVKEGKLYKGWQITRTQLKK